MCDKHLSVCNSPSKKQWRTKRKWRLNIILSLLVSAKRQCRDLEQHYPPHNASTAFKWEACHVRRTIAGRSSTWERMTRCNDYKGNCLLIVPGSKSRGGDSVSTPGVLSHPQVVCSNSRPSCSLSPHRRSTLLTHFTPIAIWRRRLRPWERSTDTTPAIPLYDDVYAASKSEDYSDKSGLEAFIVACTVRCIESYQIKEDFFYFKRR